MADAARSTRGGRLGEATEAIQRALRGAAAQAQAAASAAAAGSAPAFRSAPVPSANPMVLDGLVREVREQDGAGCLLYTSPSPRD